MTSHPMPGLNTGKIAQMLTISSRHLGPDTLSALKKARLNALERQKVRLQAAALATEGNDTFSGLPYVLQQWIVASTIVVLLVIGMSYWYHVRQEEQIADLDIAILTDDLPIDVFVDRQ